MRLSKPFISSAGLLIVLFCVGAKKVADETVSLGVEIQVGQAGASTNFSFYNTSPESPDGNYICYVRYKKEPEGGSMLVPGELWVCNRDLKKHRHITDIEGMPAHNGAEAQWLDNRHIVLHDYGIIRAIDIRDGRDILKNKIKTPGIGHDSYCGKVLFTAPGRNEIRNADIYKPDEAMPPGIYELDCFTEEVKPIAYTAAFKDVKLPFYVNPNAVWPVEDWRILHLQYSPDGKKIAFRLDVGASEPLQFVGICGMDGSRFRVFPKPLHFLWYDNESLVGHIAFDESGKRPQERSERFNIMRWDLDGKYLETFGPRGNHLAVSPDRQYFAHETFYNTDPVIMYLVRRDKKERVAEIGSFAPFDLVWKKRFHINPAFSRDSKRIYYTKPLNEKYNGTFFREIIDK